ncbi:unnamed protein product [Urochloa humidicola]
MDFIYSQMESSGTPPVNDNDTTNNLNLLAAVHTLLIENADTYTMLNGLQRYKGKLLIGCKDQLTLQLLDNFRKTALGGHSDAKATYQRLKLLFYWPENATASTHILTGLMEEFSKYQVNNSLDNALPKTLYNFQPPQDDEDILTDRPDLTALKQITNRRAAQQVVKEILKKAQPLTKNLQDKHESDREFFAEDMIYLKIQSYRYTSLSTRRSVKLSLNSTVITHGLQRR